MTGGSSVLASVIATPLLAEVCEKARPGWTPGTAATVWSEAIFLFSTPLGLALLALSAIAIRWRLEWLGLGVILGWTGFVSLIVFSESIDRTGLQDMATEEGCIGPPTLFIALAAAICVMIVFRTKPRPKGETET